MSQFGNGVGGPSWTQIISEYHMGAYSATIQNKQGCLFQLTEPASVDGIYMYIRGTNNSSLHCHVRGLIYNVVSETTNWEPNNFVGGTNDYDIPGNIGTGWYYFGFSPFIALPAGHYWLCYFAGGPSSSRCVEINYAASGGTRRIVHDEFGDGAASTFAGGQAVGGDAVLFTMVANYTPTVVNATVVAPAAQATARVPQVAAVNGIVAPPMRAVASMPPLAGISGGLTVGVPPMAATAALLAKRVHASRIPIIMYPLDDYPYEIDLVEDP